MLHAARVFTFCRSAELSQEGEKSHSRAAGQFGPTSRTARITRVTSKHERTGRKDSQMNPICGSELDSASTVQLDRPQWEPRCLVHKKHIWVEQAH